VSLILFQVRFIAVCFGLINFARGRINLMIVKFNFNSLRWKALINSINSVGFFILNQSINWKCNFNSLHPINYFIFVFKFEDFKFDFWLKFSYLGNLPNFLLSIFRNWQVFFFGRLKKWLIGRSCSLFGLAQTILRSLSCSLSGSDHSPGFEHTFFAFETPESSQLACCLEQINWDQRQIHSKVLNFQSFWSHFTPWW